jgi:hypothetical protein
VEVISGIGSIPVNRLLDATGGHVRAAAPGRFEIASRTARLSEVETAWPLDNRNRRTVFKIDGRF